jgi:hypothetical protein
MKVLKGRKKLSPVKASTFFIELLFALDMTEELSPLHRDNQTVRRDKVRIRHAGEHEIQILLRLQARTCIRNLGLSRAHGCQTVSKSALLSQIRI